MLIMSDSARDDPTVTALLAMSEFFMSQRPLAVCEAVRCLLAVLALQPVPRVEASVRLRLGLLLSEHTSCALEAKEQLEKAMLVAGTAGNLQEMRFHAASSLAALLVAEGQQQQARGLLRGKLEATSHHPYWHIRLLLQLANLLSSEGDVAGQLSVLSRCADFCQRVGAGHTHLLSTLARGAVLLTHHNYSEAGSVLNVASTLLESHRGPGLALLRTFYLTIQVTHLLMAGQVKTAKPHLKQLQQCVQSLSNQPEERAKPATTSELSGVGRGSAEDFLWLTRHHAYITVYLVSVLHSVQAGLTDKALCYVDRALELIDQETVSSPRPSGVLGVLKVHLLEQSVQCLLMRGETANATTQLQELVDVCHTHPVLVYSHRAVLHTLLGLYAFATGALDRASAQFQTALQHTNCKELRVLISLNLAICFMRIGQAKEVELAALMTSVNSDGAGITCQSLQSALSYVRGLFSFTCGRLHDAKRHLRETLTVANGSDLNKLTSCSLLLLGQIFMALGNSKETLDMVTPALQLSVKMPENRLQVWAASLLADLYHTLGEPEKEKLLRQQSSGVASQLEQDQKKAMGSSAHQLVQWTIGEWPVTTTPPVEVRGQEQAPVVCHTPPRRSSMTMNGSPVVLKTPEIVLKKVESPSTSQFHRRGSTPRNDSFDGGHRVTPPISLKSQATPPQSQAPPTKSGRRESVTEANLEWGIQGGKSGRENHYPNDSRRGHTDADHQQESDSAHRESLHHVRSSPHHSTLQSDSQRDQSTSHNLPNQNISHYQRNFHTLGNQPNQDTSYAQPNYNRSHHLSNQDRSHHLSNQDRPHHLSNQDRSHHVSNQDRSHHLSNQDRSYHISNQDRSHHLSNQDRSYHLSNQDRSHHLSNQDRSHHLPNQETRVRQERVLTHDPTPQPPHSSAPPTPQPPQSTSSLQSRHLVHPPASQISPHLHSSPSLQSPPSQGPLSGHLQQQYHRLTPPQPHFPGQEGRSASHQPSPLHQTPPSLPSYEHSIQARTPPQMLGSSPSAPHSPKLHHLSPSHTPPPSRIQSHASHPSPTHLSSMELHMLHNQQRLLWEQQKYLQAQQRAAQTGGYAVPPPGLGGTSVGLGGPSVGLGGPSVGLGGPSVGLGDPSVGLRGTSVGLRGTSVGPQYMVQGLTPPHLSHMATLQQMSREPSRSCLPALGHRLPGQPSPRPSLSSLHLLPNQPQLHYHQGHHHR